MINKLIFTAEFNVEVDPDAVFLSPGGFEFEMASGKILEFDFEDSCGGTLESDHRLVVFELSGLDIEAFPESGDYTLQDLRSIVGVSELYIDIYFQDKQPHPEFSLSGIKGITVEYYDDGNDDFINVQIADELVAAGLIDDINRSNGCGSYVKQ